MWPLLLVQGNAGALEQLFLNVLLNAAEASSAGSETLVDVRAEESTVVVCVTDTGEGIPQDQLALVGTPFYTTKSLGTGLGISLANRIAQARGGSLAIASTQGRGTSVTVVLPTRAN